MVAEPKFESGLDDFTAASATGVKVNNCPGCVGVAVAVGVFVGVFVGVRVNVGVLVGVLVGVTVGPPVFAIQVRVAGVGSIFPATSVAATWKV